MIDNYDYALAALLHDIDKIAKRADTPIKSSILNQIINTYFDNNSIQKTIEEASKLSSGKEKDDGEDNTKAENLRLYSIFQNIDIGKKYKKKNHYHKLVPISISDDIFPVKKDQLNEQVLKQEYRYLLNRIEENIEEELYQREIIKNKDEKVRAYNKIYYILERYTTFIPYSTTDKSDISLFEHLKTTSAIAACLNEYYQNGQEGDRKFLLLAGDVSGIQNFIYQVTEGEETKENVSKNLRGKSFYVNVLIDFISKYIVKELNLNISNILYCGGGTFQILLPNTTDAREKLVEIELKIQKHLYDKYKTRLGVVFAYVEIDEEGIKNYAKSLTQLHEKLIEAKNQKFLDVINIEKDDFFVRKTNFKNTCIYCNEHEGTIKGKICEECSTHISLGEKLVKSRLKYIVYDFDNEIGKWDVRVSFGSMGQVCFYSELDDTDIGFMLENINNTGEFGRIKFVGNTVPLRGGTVASFNDIAPLAEGDRKIAVLKMDIDNLGAIFSTGFEEENKSIARISTLSRMIDLFFCGYINKICDDLSKEYLEAKEDCTQVELDNLFYINFSGGDDLVIIGPWDWTINLAVRINDKLIEYVCQNPNITISGGIYIADPKTPVRITLYEGEKYLEKAKKREGKNALYMFEKDFSWEDGMYSIKKLVENGEEYTDWINKKCISRGLAYNIMIGSRNINRKGQIDFDLIPQIAYSLSRNIKDERIKNDMIGRLITPHIKDSEIEFVKYPLMIALMKTRDVKEDKYG